MLLASLLLGVILVVGLVESTKRSNRAQQRRQAELDRAAELERHNRRRP